MGVVDYHEAVDIYSILDCDEQNERSEVINGCFNINGISNEAVVSVEEKEEDAEQ